MQLNSRAAHRGSARVAHHARDSHGLRTGQRAESSNKKSESAPPRRMKAHSQAQGIVLQPDRKNGSTAWNKSNPQDIGG
jgi:hypothetical protein